MENLFYIIFLGTVLTTRTLLYVWPIPGPTIAGLRIHHYMYGAVAIGVAVLFKSVILYAVGLGLFVDELAYLFIGGRTHEDNYSAVSFIGTAVFCVITFFLRTHLVSVVMF